MLINVQYTGDNCVSHFKQDTLCNPVVLQLLKEWKLYSRFRYQLIALEVWRAVPRLPEEKANVDDRRLGGGFFSVSSYLFSDHREDNGCSDVRDLGEFLQRPGKADFTYRPYLRDLKFRSPSLRRVQLIASPFLSTHC